MAFGSRPAQGTLPGQMHVDGYNGNGLANSYVGGDTSVGTLASPPFNVERKYIQFLIGGGGWPHQTCINLLRDGKILRTATGPNTEPGGSEHLDLQQWDVSELEGAAVSIQIVDSATGSWGHINIDDIIQTDRKMPQVLTHPQINFTAKKRFLNLPVKNGAKHHQLKLLINGQAVREFEMELADAEPDWWAFLDLAPFRGKDLELQVDQLREDSSGLKSVIQTDKIIGHETLYREKLRPQFHFSSQRGWNNDPNGLVYYKGEYHMFYQHNPYGWSSGNLTWGHAVSLDLVHWRELPNALYPDEHGAMWSGSAVIDWNNTAGFQTGNEKTMVTMFTAAKTPFSQGIAFSNDRGRTWTKYSGNPVLENIHGQNRDPKVIWYAPENKWVMALYLDENNHYALFSSPDLKQWKKMSDVVLPGDGECPEFFEIAIEGDRNEKRWIFYGGKGLYLIGKFDGKTFTPESGPRPIQHGDYFYASQTFNDVPAADERRVLIPWGRMDLPKMPFNQMMGIPVEITLHKTGEGLRLFANPVRELASLRARNHVIKAQTLPPNQNPLGKLKGELIDVAAEIATGDAVEIGFNLRGITVMYDVKKRELSFEGTRAVLPLENGKIRLRILVDRASVDIFGNDGSLYMPVGVILPAENKSLEVYAKGGDAHIISMEVHELKSAWK